MYPPLTDPEPRALLAAIAEFPEDPTPRLILGDWLEERGDARAPWVRDAAIWQWMAPDARDPVPSLLATLESLSYEDQMTARDVLITIGPSAGRAVREWLRERRSPYVWDLVGSVLLPAPPRDLIPVSLLIDILIRGDVHQRLEAVIDLGFHGPAATPEVDSEWLLSRAWQMVEQLDDYWYLIDRNKAHTILTLVHRLDPSGTDFLMRIVCEMGGWWRYQAIEMLGQIGPPAAIAVPILIDLLDSSLPHEVNDVCEPIAIALPNLGESGRTAVPALDAALERYPSDCTTRQAILTTLAALRHD